MAEYRPRKAMGLLVVAIWVLTASVLAWLGVILGPEDREAMDGLSRLLFTVVPIRFFSWAMAAVFLWMGVRTGRHVFGREPSLAISADGLRFRDGEWLAWAAVESVESQEEGMLRIELLSPGEPASKTEGIGFLGRLRSGKERGSKVLSSFELGAPPVEVVAKARDLSSRSST